MWKPLRHWRRNKILKNLKKARDGAWDSAGSTTVYAARSAAWSAAWNATWYAAWYSARSAAGSAAEAAKFAGKKLNHREVTLELV
jgi:hypothetical protein